MVKNYQSILARVIAQATPTVYMKTLQVKKSQKQTDFNQGSVKLYDLYLGYNFYFGIVLNNIYTLDMLENILESICGL